MQVEEIKTHLEDCIEQLKESIQEIWDKEDIAVKIYGSKKGWREALIRENGQRIALENFLEFIKYQETKK